MNTPRQPMSMAIYALAIVTAAIVLLFALTDPAWADITTNSGATNTSSTASTSNNAGNAQNINFNSPDGVSYDGKYTVKSAPGIGLGAFSGSFSTDYCLGTAQIGASFLGGSVGGGAPVSDLVCQKLRVYERIQQGAASDPLNADFLHSAAYEMLCTVSPESRKALGRQGLCKGLDDDDKAAAETK